MRCQRLSRSLSIMLAHWQSQEWTSSFWGRSGKGTGVGRWKIGPVSVGLREVSVWSVEAS